MSCVISSEWDFTWKKKLKINKNKWWRRFILHVKKIFLSFLFFFFVFPICYPFSIEPKPAICSYSWPPFRSSSHSQSLLASQSSLATKTFIMTQPPPQQYANAPNPNNFQYQPQQQSANIPQPQPSNPSITNHVNIFTTLCTQQTQLLIPPSHNFNRTSWWRSSWRRCLKQRIR